MQNSVVVFTFFLLDWKSLFGKFGLKNLNYKFMLKLSIMTNLNMQNSMVMLTFSVFIWKYTFWANLFQEIKIVNLGLNFASRLI